MISPANAVSSNSRRWLMKLTTVLGRISLPLRTTFRRMPRVNSPLVTRKKAMRSRCAGSMLAWILKTTPENFFSSGVTTRCMAARGAGAGARSTSASSTSCTPKLLMAEPKNMGVCLPLRNSSRLNSGDAPFNSSSSSCACVNSAPKRLLASALSRPDKISSSPPALSSPGLKTRMRASRRS